MKPIVLQVETLQKPWSGTKLPKYRADIRPGTGITWEVSAHESQSNPIEKGPWAGTTFYEFLHFHKTECLGSYYRDQDFPFRLALMDAGESLSIQVHPDSPYALTHETDRGKNEIWYIIEADPDATIVAGTSASTNDELKTALESGKMNDYLTQIPVEKGDLVHIPAGMLHALGAGILALEVGQNSDLTYRVYDFDRGRPLDIEKSFAVIDPSLEAVFAAPINEQCHGYTVNKEFSHPAYHLTILDVETSYKGKCSEDRFHLLTCLDGTGKLHFDDETIHMETLQTILIPAGNISYEVSGSCRIMISDQI